AGETPAIQQFFVLRWIGCLLDWMRLASSKAGGLKKRTGRTLCRRDACNPAALCASLDWMSAGLDACWIGCVSHPVWPAALRKEQVAPSAGETPAIQQLFHVNSICAFICGICVNLLYPQHLREPSPPPKRKICLQAQVYYTIY
ncbi:MAG: hypothetical protein RBR69_05960, partial [Candidatus Cloacimonadaceae bacterium]|nr:hypothetical protein [Candidatus Cloacimonadaceae bacterium]